MRRYLFAALAALALAGCASQPSALDLVEGRINREADGFQIADVSLPPQGVRANVIDALTAEGLTVPVMVDGGTQVAEFDARGLAVTDGGSLDYHPGGLLYSTGSSAANDGGGEDDLHSYTVPAGLLATDGDLLRVRATFTLNGGSTLTVKSHFGTDSDTHYATSGWTGEKAFVELEIIRTGATTQLMRWRQQYSPTPASAVAVENYTQTLANALVLKFTGQSSSSTSGAVTQTSMSVEFVPAP